MQPSQACAALIQQSEGCAHKQPDGSFAAYPDPGTGGDPWTIGWGSTGADIRKGLVWTQQQCDERFSRDLAAFGAKVAEVIGNAPTTQHQFDAMVSFAYNVGIANLAASTLLRKHKAGDYAARPRSSASGTRPRTRCSPAWSRGGPRRPRSTQARPSPQRRLGPRRVKSAGAFHPRGSQPSLG